MFRTTQPLLLTAGLLTGLIATPTLAASFTGSYAENFDKSTASLGSEWTGALDGSASAIKDGTVDSAFDKGIFHTGGENRGLDVHHTGAGNTGWFELRLTNDTGADINTLDVAFDPQVFFFTRGDVGRSGDLRFSLDSGSGLTTVTTFDFATDNALASEDTWLTDAQQSSLGLVQAYSASITLTNIWSVGEELVLRWSKLQTQLDKNVHTGIDNLVVGDAPGTAIPTPDPASAGLALLGMMGLLRRRR